NQLSILGASEQELQHHVVGQQDIGRIAPDLLAFWPLLLPSEAPEPYGGFTVRVALFDKFPEFLGLAVGQRVHRIDHNRLDAAPRTVPKNVVNNGDDVGKALAGP